MILLHINKEHAIKKKKVHAPDYLCGLYFNILFVILFMKIF